MEGRNIEMVNKINLNLELVPRNSGQSTSPELCGSQKQPYSTGEQKTRSIVDSFYV